MILRKAYEDHVEQIYRMILEDLDRPEGWFHPTIVTPTNDQFAEMELKVLSSVQQD